MSSDVTTYDPGDAVRLSGTFTNVGGTYTDPTEVYLHILPPAQYGGVVPGTVAYTYGAGEVTRQAAGSFTYDLNPLPSGTPGLWRYVFVGTGVCNAAVLAAFGVRRV